MGVSKPKERMTREEIEEILECNTRLFKNDPYFSKYIVLLTSYLMEFHNYEYRERVTTSHFTRNTTGFRSKLLISGDSWDNNEPDYCSGCGSPLNGDAKCPNCGQIII